MKRLVIGRVVLHVGRRGIRHAGFYTRGGQQLGVFGPGGWGFTARVRP